MVSSSKFSTPQGRCSRNTIKLTNPSQRMKRSMCLKHMMREILKHRIETPTEEFDIPTELNLALQDFGVTFENYTQEQEITEKYLEDLITLDNNILRMSINGTIIIPTEEEKQYTHNEEDVKANIDFFYHDAADEEGKFIGVQFKTSTFSTSKQSTMHNMEAIVLEPFIRDFAIRVDANPNLASLGNLYLSSDNKRHRDRLQNDYNMTHIEYASRKTRELLEKAQQVAEIEQAEGCSKEDCASCARNNICNFEEPPIALPTDNSVSSIENLRLSEAQKEIVDFEEGIARVNAGAGAGKTLVVALRVAELIKKGEDPTKICLLTFTRTGAAEMTARATKYLADQGIISDPDLLTSTTLNSFCQKIIEENYEALGYERAPRIIPDEVRAKIINDVLGRHPKISNWNYGFSGKYVKNALVRTQDVFAKIKKEKITLEDCIDKKAFLPGVKELSDIMNIFDMFEEFEGILKQRCQIEFEDQFDLINKLLEINPNLFDEIGFEHLIVDEFQDSNEKQINLINKIIDQSHFKSFMAVGDDSQAIFGFNGTTPEYIINFDNYFGNYTNFDLIDNFRSGENIIENANVINTFVTDRVEKDLVAAKSTVEPINVKPFYTPKQEITYIADSIKRSVEEGKNPADIAVLCRNGKELRAIASELTKREVPSVIVSKTYSKDNCRVKAICTFYNSYTKGTSQGFLDYENVLEHGGLKNKSDDYLNTIIEQKTQEYSNVTKSLDGFKKLAKDLDIEQVDECYQDFLEKINYCETMEELDEFFESFELYGDNTTFTREGYYDGVNLSTIHASKGLEWDTTYLSLSQFDKVSFHNSPARNSQEINEAYRLWFVGATRAKSKLIETGQYLVCKTMKDGIVKNDFLKNALDIQGEDYLYNTGNYLAQLEAEKAEDAIEL